MYINKTFDFHSLPKTTKLFLVIIFLPASYFTMTSFLKNEAYYLSIEKIAKHDEVIMYLGTPLKTGYFLFGEVSNTESEVNYSVSGPIDSADVYLYARAINGSWVILDLEVTVNSINKKIDTLAVP